MRKRYVPRKKDWKWPIPDEISLQEFERDWKGGRGFILKRRESPARRPNPTFEEMEAALLADDPELRALRERDRLVEETVRSVMEDRGLPTHWAMLIAYAVIDELEDTGWL